MPRYKILIEYDGTGFCGWQKQSNGVSIQVAIEDAILKFTEEKVEIFGASRTDAGVHARGQVAHFDLAKNFPEKTIVAAINYHLRPNKISIIECKKVGQDFHARFSAKRKLYEYTILNRLSPPTIDREYAWYVRPKLNIAAMRGAANLIQGQHDFIGLQTSECQSKSTVRTIESIIITKKGDKILIKISAQSFIHKMVRNIVGALKMVGTEHWNAEKVKATLNATKPIEHKLTAPAKGLCLMKISY